MDILFACHCPPPAHNILYVSTPDGSSKILNSSVYPKYGIKSVSFVDPYICKEQGDWSTILPDSKDLVWPISCPIFPIFWNYSISEHLIVSFFTVLKVGGKLYIEVPEDLLKKQEQTIEDSIESFNSIVNPLLKDKDYTYSIKIVPKEGIPMIFSKFNKVSPKYYEITKLAKSEGGARRKHKRKTRRRKSRRSRKN